MWRRRSCLLAPRACCSLATRCYSELEKEFERLYGSLWLEEYAALLRKCGNNRALAVGQRVHNRLLELGKGKMVLLLKNRLVEMYGKCGCLGMAKQVFDGISDKNELSWNVMVAAYAQNEDYSRCLSISRMMNLEGSGPDRVSCIAVLDACGKLGCLSQAKGVHQIAVDSGYENDVVVGTAVITMYSRCGTIEQAKNMFEKMPVRNVVSWSAMVAAFAQNGLCEESLKVFLEMQQEGVKANERTLVSVLDACAGLGMIRQGRAVHDWIMEAGFESDVILANALINMYGRCGRVQEARGVFDWMPNRNLVSWNTMIAACSRQERCQEAVSLFSAMDLEGLEPNKITFISMVDVCGNTMSVAEGTLMHECVVDAGLETVDVIGNALVNMYGKFGRLETAEKVLDKIQGRDKVSFATMLASYAKHGRAKEALDLFKVMDLEGIKPDGFTFVSLMDSCVNLAAAGQGQPDEAKLMAEALALGEQVHDRLLRSGVQVDAVLRTSVVNMYGKCGNPDKARAWFDSMAVKDDIAVWNAMLAAYSLRSQGKEALDLFQRMELEGVRPDELTLLAVLEACTILGTIERGQLVHSRICNSWSQPKVVIVSALINLYAKCGSLSRAKDVFDQAHQSDVVTWSTMLTAYAQNGGHSREALRCFYQMQQQGVQPDGISFINVLSGCNKAGQAVDLLCSLKYDYGIDATPELYGSLVEVFVRAGWLEEAEYIARNSTAKTNFSTWTTLLAACRTHSDLIRAHRVAVRVHKLRPWLGEPLQLLANTYSLGLKWDQISGARMSTVHRGFMKQPGCSWMEIKGRIYEFHVESPLPRSEEIFAELERLYPEIRKAGYEPDPARMVYELGEQETKFMLCYHSEKLAVGFGLISTPSGTTLRVVKNLATCKNCHSAIKFIAKVVSREIVLRDSNRVHHFQDGSCSCGK